MRPGAAITNSVPHTTPATWRALAFHLAALWTLISAYRNLSQPSPIATYITAQFGSWNQFLTVLGLKSATITMCLAVLKDVLPGLPVLDGLKNGFGLVTVPLEGMIAVLYWSLKAYDPNLLMPPDPRFRIPLPLDLSLHAIPAILLWVDFLLLSPPFSEKCRPLLLSVLMTLGYTTWMEYCRSKNGVFPYPFLGDMASEHRIAFYTVCAAGSYLLFKLANSIHIGVDRLLDKDVSRALQQAQGKSL